MQIADVNKAYNGEASGEFFHTDNKVQRELVIDKLRKMGCRITKQRLLLLDIILERSAHPVRRYIIRLPG